MGKQNAVHLDKAIQHSNFEKQTHEKQLLVSATIQMDL